jgi:hypothetical protein
VTANPRNVRRLWHSKTLIDCCCYGSVTKFLRPVSLHIRTNSRCHLSVIHCWHGEDIQEGAGYNVTFPCRAPVSLVLTFLPLVFFSCALFNFSNFQVSLALVVLKSHPSISIEHPLSSIGFNVVHSSRSTLAKIGRHQTDRGQCFL